MASSFHITVTPNKNALYIQIQGGFDGSSAQQLLYTLKQYMDHTSRVIINTDNISYFDTLGVNLLRYRIGTVTTSTTRMTFIGDNASIFQSITPSWHCQ